MDHDNSGGYSRYETIPGSVERGASELEGKQSTNKKESHREIAEYDSEETVVAGRDNPRLL